MPGHSGAVVMWHQGSALGVHLVHTELAPSKARCEEHAEGVDEAALKKASATEPEIRHKASAQAAGAERAEVKERDWAGGQGTAPNPCGTCEQHTLPRKVVAVPDVQKGKLRGREQHRDSPKLPQWQSWHSDPILAHPGSHPAHQEASSSPGSPTAQRGGRAATETDRATQERWQ